MASMMRWHPFRGLARMQREMDRLFEELLGRPLVRWESEEGVRFPAVDVTETDKELVVKAELPGVDKDKIDIEVLPDALTIKAERSQEREEKEVTHHYRECVWGRLERSIPLPVEVIADQVKASHRDGILEIRLPKSERARALTPRKVRIE